MCVARMPPGMPAAAAAGRPHSTHDRALRRSFYGKCPKKRLETAEAGRTFEHLSSFFGVFNSRRALPLTRRGSEGRHAEVGMRSKCRSRRGSEGRHAEVGMPCRPHSGLGNGCRGWLHCQSEGIPDSACAVLLTLSVLIEGRRSGARRVGAPSPPPPLPSPILSLDPHLVP